MQLDGIGNAGDTAEKANTYPALTTDIRCYNLDCYRVLPMPLHCSHFVLFLVDALHPRRQAPAIHAYAMRQLRIGDKRGRLLTEAERYAIADHVMASLRLYGDQWRLDEEIEVQVGHR